MARFRWPLLPSADSRTERGARTVGTVLREPGIAVESVLKHRGGLSAEEPSEPEADISYCIRTEPNKDHHLSGRSLLFESPEYFSVQAYLLTESDSDRMTHDCHF